jgi:hypothetical protein
VGDRKWIAINPKLMIRNEFWLILCISVAIPLSFSIVISPKLVKEQELAPIQLAGNPKKVIIFNHGNIDWET